MSTKVKRIRRRPAPDPQAFAYTVPDAIRIGSLGRTNLYRLMASGELKFVQIGGRRMVVGDSLRALLTGVTMKEDG